MRCFVVVVRNVWQQIRMAPESSNVQRSTPPLRLHGIGLIYRECHDRHGMAIMLLTTSWRGSYPTSCLLNRRFLDQRELMVLSIQPLSESIDGMQLWYLFPPPLKMVLGRVHATLPYLLQRDLYSILQSLVVKSMTLSLRKSASPFSPWVSMNPSRQTNTSHEERGMLYFLLLLPLLLQIGAAYRVCPREAVVLNFKCTSVYSVPLAWGKASSLDPQDSTPNFKQSRISRKNPVICMEACKAHLQVPLDLRTIPEPFLALRWPVLPWASGQALNPSSSGPSDLACWSHPARTEKDFQKVLTIFLPMGLAQNNLQLQTRCSAIKNPNELQTSDPETRRSIVLIRIFLRTETTALFRACDIFNPQPTAREELRLQQLCVKHKSESISSFNTCILHLRGTRPMCSRSAYAIMVYAALAIMTAAGWRGWWCIWKTSKSVHFSCLRLGGKKEMQPQSLQSESIQAIIQGLPRDCWGSSRQFHFFSRLVTLGS